MKKEINTDTQKNQYKQTEEGNQHWQNEEKVCTSKWKNQNKGKEIKAQNHSIYGLKGVFKYA